MQCKRSHTEDMRVRYLKERERDASFPGPPPSLPLPFLAFFSAPVAPPLAMP